MEFASTRDSLVDPKTQRKGVTRHFRVVLNGRTKQRRAGGSTVFLPCASVTRRSKIKAELWVKRHVDFLVEEGRTGCYLSGSHDPHAPTLDFMAEDFYVPLEEVQALRDSPIPADLDVRDAYGIWRSLRRGVTAHATNVGVGRDLINLMNRWSNELHRMGQGASMFDVYTEMDALVPTTVRYSLSL